MEIEYAAKRQYPADAFKIRVRIIIASRNGIVMLGMGDTNTVHTLLHFFPVCLIFLDFCYGDWRDGFGSLRKGMVVECLSRRPESSPLRTHLVATMIQIIKFKHRESKDRR